jgi:transposase
MAGRRKDVLEIREIIRRFKLGEYVRRIAEDMQISRNTVRHYLRWAKEQGFLEAAELPPPELMQERYRTTILPPPPGPSSLVEPHRDFVIQMRQRGVEVQALFGLLRERGFEGSYSSLLRYVHRIEPKTPETFVRVETAPGEEAQVDFGYAGMLYDPFTERLRKAWVFVMTLSWSRHEYAEIVFDQKVETWCALHVRAFEFFGGVVKRVKIDNLKAAIIDAVVNDPVAQRAYCELAEHYHFSISPCRPRTPRHKGKVEKGGVHYVKRNALAGRTFRDRDAANQHLIHWIMTTAGTRDHGTTHEPPLVRFEIEKTVLGKLPETRYEPCVWKAAKLHPDCHVVFEYCYYSAPHRLVGQALMLRVTAEKVEIYHEHVRIATHPRAAGRGVRVTITDHLPPEKIQGLLTSTHYVQKQAAEIGPSTAEFIDRLLGQKPMDRLRGAQGIISMAKRVGAERLEAACTRALAYDSIRYQTVRNILRKGLDQKALDDPALTPAPLPKTSVHARPISQQLPFKSF